jgi:hypothetical protein
MKFSNIQSSNSGLEIIGAFSKESRRSQPLAQASTNEITADTTDILDLSAESQTIADTLNSAGSPNSLFNATMPGGILVSEAGLQESEAALQVHLQDVFAAYGIDSSNKIDLQIGCDGRVVVVNDNLQKTQIEQLFKDNPELRDEFAKYSAQSSLFNAAKEASAFQNAYAHDPIAAVAQFSYLFDATAKPTVILAIQNNNIQTLFN